MSTTLTTSLDSIAGGRDSDTAEILAGLSADPPHINSKYLYDRRGSELFDQICGLDEYYPTRTEQGIMQRHAVAMAGTIPAGSRLIELGSGSSLKTRVLLSALPPGTTYHPVDISREHLHATADSLRIDFPHLTIKPVVADFTQDFKLSPTRADAPPDQYYFPGSTIGNFEPPVAKSLLRQIAGRSGRGGGLLIGFDLQKSVRILEAAYNDIFGVTAAFTRNLLVHVNAMTDANFQPHQFAHHAFYNDTDHRIEIYLESKANQRVHIAGQTFHYQPGDRIRTEYSHKYTIDGFEKMAHDCGWRMTTSWTDPRKFFAVAKLEVA